MNAPQTVALVLDAARLPKFDLPVSLDPHPVFGQALGCLGRGESATCLTAIAALPAEDRTRVAFAILEPLAHFMLGQDEACIAAVNALIARHGAHPYVLLLQGVSLERAGKGPAAAAAFAGAWATACGLAVPAAPEAAALPCMAHVVRENPKLTSNVFVKHAREGLYRLGFWDRIAPAAGHELATWGSALTAAGADTKRIYDACSFLGLDGTRAPAWSDAVFESFALSIARNLLDARRLHDAINLESHLFESYGKSRETADHYRRVCALLTPMFGRAGRTFAADAAALPRPKKKARYRVAFVIKHLVPLAHAEVAFDIVEAIQRRSDRRVDCLVIGIIGQPESFRHRATASGIRVVMAADVSARHSSAENLVLAVRSFAVAEQIDAVVWVTDGPTAAFAFAVRLAPVQIFFSMKYHSFAAPEVDAYLTGGPAGQVFMTAEGREWRVAQTCYRDLFDSGRTGQAAKIRAALGSDRVILGCLGREQKIDSVPFLAAIAAVLRRTPNALFLWTGRDHVTGIQSALEREGVAAQCRFIGWVDTRVYAQVFDIFLDSFPFPCGVTALQAMAAAKPVVFFDSPEARETGVPLFVQPLIEGSAGTVDQQARARAILRPDGSPANFLMASDAGAYAGYAEALIADPTMRLRVGRALRDFVDAFLTDAEACGQSYERHIVDVIEAAAGSGGGPRAPFGHH